jgi:hypothetical protein
MGKEQMYLSLVETYLRKVVGFVSYVCLEFEPMNWKVVEECIAGVVEAVGSHHPASK